MANQSTINPQLPAMLTPLQSSVVRANFRAAYNDINAIWAAIVGVGSGSGITSQLIIASGSSGIATYNQFVGFKSASGAPKTLAIPPPGGTLAMIIIADLEGDADPNAITPVPTSGIIIGTPTPSVYTNYGSITLLDTNAGWVSI